MKNKMKKKKMDDEAKKKMKNERMKKLREATAISEGRTPGIAGRPPMLEKHVVPILVQRVKNKILNKEQVHGNTLLELVYFYKICVLKDP
jgi:hypothetical protein